MHWRRLPGALFLAALAGAPSCSSKRPTGLVLAVSTDLSPQQLDTLHLEVVRDDQVKFASYYALGSEVGENSRPCSRGSSLRGPRRRFHPGRPCGSSTTCS